MFRQDKINEAQQLAGLAMSINPHFNPEDARELPLTADAIGYAKKASHLQRLVFSLLAQGRKADDELFRRRPDDELQPDAEQVPTKACALVDSALTLSIVAYACALMAQSWSKMLATAKTSVASNKWNLKSLWEQWCSYEHTKWYLNSLAAVKARLQKIDLSLAEHDSQYAAEMLLTARSAMSHAKVMLSLSDTVVLIQESLDCDEKAGTLTQL